MDFFSFKHYELSDIIQWKIFHIFWTKWCKIQFNNIHIQKLDQSQLKNAKDLESNPNHNINSKGSECILLLLLVVHDFNNFWIESNTICKENPKRIEILSNTIILVPNNINRSFGFHPRRRLYDFGIHYFHIFSKVSFQAILYGNWARP